MFHSLPAKEHTLALIAVLLGALVACGIAIAILHRTLSPRGRRWFTILITFLGGLYLGLEYFLPVRQGTLWPTGYDNTQPSPANILTPGIEPFSNWLTVVGAFTVGLGIYSLVQVHGRKVVRRYPGWSYSFAFFISMLAMFVFALWEHQLTKQKLPEGVMPWPKVVYEFLFGGMYVPLQAATFSLLAFYIASAAYRAFRVRTTEAGLMMAAAFLVMLGQVPVGSWVTGAIPLDSPAAFFRLEALGEWIMRWLNTPAQRAITFGIAVGGLAMSLRVWLSLERGTFFAEK